VNWTYSLSERARKEFLKLDRQAQKDILRYFDTRLAGTGNPRRFGKALRGDLVGIWRYHVGDFRILCQIMDRQLLILVVSVGHRKNVYD
jgi:mRNA interferase RelE/StbE